jgi:hypothetical protein
MILGGFTFGLIVSQLGELSKQQNVAEVMRQEKFDLIGAMLRSEPAKLVDPTLRRRVLEFYDYAFTRQTVMDYRGLILDCPPALRDQLAQQMRWVDGDGPGILHNVPFFAGLDTVSTIEVCARMRPILAEPMVEEADGSRLNMIMQEGDAAEEMCKHRNYLYHAIALWQRF